MNNWVRLNEKGLGSDQIEMTRIWRSEYLRPRAVTDAKYMTDAQLSLNPHCGALVFPYLDWDGNPTDFYRWRLPNEGFRQPKDTDSHLYIPPLKHKTKSMRDVLSDPSEPLIIAEGETRALALNSRGLPTVAIGGIHSYQKDGRLIGDIARIPFQDREVFYVFDYDITTRNELQIAVVDFSEQLTARGADVKLVPTPMVNGDLRTGADDYINAEGIAAFKKLLKEAKPLDHPQFASWGKDGVNIELTLLPVADDWLTKKPPELTYTWDGFLPRRTVGLLIASGGTGKTYLAQALAQAVAGGVPFLGRETTQGIAIHIAFEETPDELRRRQYAIFNSATSELPKNKISRLTKALNGHLYIKSVVGQELHLAVMDGSNVVQGRRALNALIYQLQQLGNVELVIIDPLSRAHSIDSESQAWGTTIINACERIAQEVGCTVLLTHHTGKADLKQRSRTPGFSRGASALPDAARVVLNLIEATTEDVDHMTNVSADDIAQHRVLKLINAKMSYGPRQPDTWLWRSPDGVLTPFEPSTKGVTGLKEKFDLLYQFYEGTGRKPFSIRDVQRARREIFDTKESERSVSDLIREARNLGSIIESREKVRGKPKLQFSEDYRPEGVG